MRAGLYHITKHVNGFTTATINSNTTTNGVTVDLQQTTGGDWRTALFLVFAGTVTDGTYTLGVQDSPDNSTWTTQTASDLRLGPSSTITSTGGTAEVEYTGNQRYCRLIIVSTGVTTGGSFTCRAVLSGTGALKR